MTFTSMRLFTLFALIATVCTAEDGGSGTPDFSSIPGLGGDKYCPNFRCPSPLEPVQKSRAKWTSRGCSAMSGSGMMSMGSDVGNEKYAFCCDQWHACYQTCGAAKASCDAIFKKCSAVKCGSDDKCKSSADISIMMVEIGGCKAYNQDQNQACECVGKDKIVTKRSDVISAFYKKFSPGSISKAPALAIKTETNGKMAVLFRKLLNKYPLAIKKVKDPSVDRYEEMMRNSAKREPPKRESETSAGSDEENLDDIWDSEEVEEL